METAENTINLNFFTATDVAKIFGPNFLDADVCRQWILRRLHPDGAFCPCCGSGLTGTALGRFWQSRTVTCRSCGRDFTARTGTILAGKNLSYQEIVLMAWLMARGDSNSEISEIIGCNRETVRLWRFQLEG
ncbi:hypothetical protein HNR65_002147 [Desulfosalsimonas propionicica]|uniref:Transposase n=1 Tax=Desulfosalsimonas propionicica TaxID=332175 RepID=A0A7W0C9U4_9BACT|nr:hypothetical protein [Desulfosalsimonas propionicica]